MPTKTLAALLGQTQADIIKAVDAGINTPYHDVADNAFTTGSRQSVTGSTEYDFEANASFEVKNFPAHITEMWNATSNKCVFSELQDSPMCVARVQLNFDPSAASAGFVEFKAYIDETTPQLIQTIRIPYKATDSRMEALFSFYVGSETGYDMKTNGLKITYTPDANGEVYDRGILVYKT